MIRYRGGAVNAAALGAALFGGAGSNPADIRFFFPPVDAGLCKEQNGSNLLWYGAACVTSLLF